VVFAGGAFSFGTPPNVRMYVRTLACMYVGVDVCTVCKCENTCMYACKMHEFVCMCAGM